MGYVSAGAVSADENPAEVAVVVDPLIFLETRLIQCMGADPFQGGGGVVVRRREGVFRGEAVLDWEDEGAGFGGEEVGVAVVEEGEGGFQAESAAVDVE